MTDFKPTAEQEAIVAFAQNETANLAVVARAGAAKTSTLVLVAEALPKTSILCLAFNKAIATEMAERLPKNCVSKTLHGLGYAAWSSFIQPRCKLNNHKSFLLLKAAVNKLSHEDQEGFFEFFAETLEIISKAKQQGYLPKDYSGHWKPLISEPEEFFSALPMEPSALQESLVNEILIKSFKSALQGDIDFDDMIYCPAICSVLGLVHELYLVDESQDLSPLNHHILRKMVRNRRIIAVGDPFQAIYGFRGADTRSMENLIKQFSMERLHLTTTFRCAKNIVKTAQWRAPDLKAADWSPEGIVQVKATWSVEDFEDGDAVICRNNAPLFKLAVGMLEHGKLPQIAGRDIAVPLKKVMQKLGKPLTIRAAALDALSAWEAKELSRARDGAVGSIRDKAACIRTILNQTQTLGDAIAYLEHLLAKPGRVFLMTGHKSKGLEYPRVYFLEPKLCNPDYEQDLNLRYVIETRAKHEPYYINFGGQMDE